MKRLSFEVFKYNILVVCVCSMFMSMREKKHMLIWASWIEVSAKLFYSALKRWKGASAYTIIEKRWNGKFSMHACNSNNDHFYTHIYMCVIMHEWQIMMHANYFVRFSLIPLHSILTRFCIIFWLVDWMYIHFSSHLYDYIQYKFLTHIALSI